MDACIFISTSDNTFDVFQLIGPRILKILPVTNLPLYVGLNKRVADSPFKTIQTTPSGWKTELDRQIKSLPTDIGYVILILDDFWFHENIERNYLEGCIDLAKEMQADYLRLRPLERSFLIKVYRYFKGLLIKQSCAERLNQHEPYYSSLQVAIWKRDYLLERLKLKGNIWDFEHISPPGSRHFALTRSELRYEHLVEKGKWYPHAPKLIGIDKDSCLFRRGFNKNLTLSNRLYHRLKFLLIGYGAFRLRKFIANR